VTANILGNELDLIREERRHGADRRTRTCYALLRGGLRPRRRGPRRAHEHGLVARDFHEGRWLAIGVLILLLSVTDALLTLLLLSHGALEANPVMALFVRSGTHGFVAVKLALTAGGVVLLAVVARGRAFGWLPVSTILYALLVAYLVLIGYELWLLHQVAAWPLFGAVR
jgi:hypothetical protein